jgi:PBP1b-binding outer membrane lipoprotein LpoB
MDNKWVLLFAVLFLAGIVVTSGCVSQQSTPQTTTTPSGTQAQVSGTGTTFPTIKQPTPITIPVTGIFVKVSYIGGFNGTYGINNVMQKVRNSGDRLYTIEGETGTVTATFSKEDRSSHALTAEIWKDGKLLTSAANSTAFGKVSVAYQV